MSTLSSQIRTGLPNEYLETRKMFRKSDLCLFGFLILSRKFFYFHQNVAAVKRRMIALMGSGERIEGTDHDEFEGLNGSTCSRSMPGALECCCGAHDTLTRHVDMTCHAAPRGPHHRIRFPAIVTAAAVVGAQAHPIYNPPLQADLLLSPVMESWPKMCVQSDFLGGCSWQYVDVPGGIVEAVQVRPVQPLAVRDKAPCSIFAHKEGIPRGQNAARRFVALRSGPFARRGDGAKCA